MGSVIGSVNGANYGNIVTVNGRTFTSTANDKDLPEAASLKVIALDDKGKELQSYTFPASAGIEVNVFGATGTTLKEVSTQTGKISILSVDRVGSVHSAAGNIAIEKATANIGNVSTMSGSITVTTSGSVSNCSTMSGNVSHHKLPKEKKTRDASPPRKTSKKQKSKDKYEEDPFWG